MLWRIGKTDSARAPATMTKPAKTPPKMPSDCSRASEWKSRRSFSRFILRWSGKIKTSVSKCGPRTFPYRDCLNRRGCYQLAMKKLFKWLFRLALVLVLLIVLLILFRDPIAKGLVERRIRQQTGLPVKIGKLSVGLRRPTLSIDNFKLRNSPGFGGSTFIDVPLLRVQYDLAALRSRRIHLNTVLLNLGELHIVQNKDG